MDLIKFLIDEPGKIKLLIINFFKLLLTLLIAHGISKLCEYNVVDKLLHWNTKLHIGSLLLYAALIVAIWFILWYILDLVFVLLLSIRGEIKRDIESARKGFIAFMLRLFGAYSEEVEENENGEKKVFVIPGENIHTIIDLADEIEANEAFDMKNSSFAEILLILTIGWFYLLFNREFLDLDCWKLILLSLIPTFGIAIYRTLDAFLITFKDHSSSYSKFFGMLEYRKLIMDTVLQDFGGRVNVAKNTFDLNWGNCRYCGR